MDLFRSVNLDDSKQHIVHVNPTNQGYDYQVIINENSKNLNYVYKKQKFTSIYIRDKKSLRFQRTCEINPQPMGHTDTPGVGDVAVQHGTVTIAKLVHVVGGRILL